MQTESEGMENDFTQMETKSWVSNTCVRQKTLYNKDCNKRERTALQNDIEINMRTYNL